MIKEFKSFEEMIKDKEFREYHNFNDVLISKDILITENGVYRLNKI